MIKHIAYVAYPAADVAATRAWYETNLGLVFAGAYVEDGEELYNEAHLDGGASFALMAPKWVEREAGTASGVVFEVENLDEAIGTLRDRGVATTEVFDGPVCRQTTLRDPDGNKVTLHEKRALARST